VRELKDGMEYCEGVREESEGVTEVKDGKKFLCHYPKNKVNANGDDLSLEMLRAQQPLYSKRVHPLKYGYETVMA